jgi:prolyl-tRNA synthetase
MEASYRVPFLIDRTEMPHMSTEESILKAVNKIMRTMLGEKDCKELNAPALSNNELQHRTGDE